MKNPFRSEGDAFRFVWLTIGYFALIVIGAIINKWVGVGVFVVLSAAILWWIFFRGRGEEPPRRISPPLTPHEYRILVIANETAGGEELMSEIQTRAGGRNTTVLVVSPALNTPLKHWLSDEDQARAEAQTRLDESVGAMRAAGLLASGQIGDGDPVQAIEDALRLFQPDELIVSTHPPGRSNWLERGVIERARERFDIPLTHVVVDLDAERR